MFILANFLRVAGFWRRRSLTREFWDLKKGAWPLTREYWRKRTVTQDDMWFWSFSFQLYLNSLTAFNYTVLCTLLFSWRSFRKTSASSSPSTFFLQYGDKRFQVTSNPENGIFLPSPFTEHLSHKLSLKQNSSVDERPFFSRPAGSSSLPTLLWSAKILFGDSF